MKRNTTTKSPSKAPENGGKPPFVFRAASNDKGSRASRGLNTTLEIDPLFGTNTQYEKDLFGPKNCIKIWHMIYDHINYEYDTPSEFISWSPSLLFVLQHAIRKTWSQGEENVLIYVLDTATLDASRIHYVPDLLKEHDLTWATYKATNGPMSEYAKSEYLIHGKLTNTNVLWKAVKLDRLVHAGLWSMFPALERTHKDDILHQRLIELRHGYFYGRDAEHELPYVNSDLWLRVGGYFGREWEGVVVLALLASKGCNLSEDSVRKMRTRLGSMKLPKFPRPAEPAQRRVLREIHKQWEGVPEAQQFMILLRLIDDMERTHRETDESQGHHFTKKELAKVTAAQGVKIEQCVISKGEEDGLQLLDWAVAGARRTCVDESLGRSDTDGAATNSMFTSPRSYRRTTASRPARRSQSPMASPNQTNPYSSGKRTYSSQKIHFLHPPRDKIQSRRAPLLCTAFWKVKNATQIDRFVSGIMPGLPLEMPGFSNY